MINKEINIRRYKSDWTKLVCKEAGQSLEELKTFLISKKLIDFDGNITKFAKMKKFTKVIDGLLFWDKKRYTTLVNPHNVVVRLVNSKKKVSEKLMKQSLWKIRDSTVNKKSI